MKLFSIKQKDLIGSLIASVYGHPKFVTHSYLTSKQKRIFPIAHFLTCKIYKSGSAKLLENRGCLRFVKNKIEPKTCKPPVNSILALASHCSCKGYFVTTI